MYNCHNPKRIKLITQPHLGLRYLREYKLKHIFKTRLIFYAIVVAFAVMILNPQCNPCNESTISSTVPYCVCEQPKKICHCLCSSSSLFLSRRLFWTKYQKLLSIFSPIVTSSTSDQDQSYQYDMSRTFKQRPLEIKSSGVLKQQHLKAFNY